MPITMVYLSNKKLITQKEKHVTKKKFLERLRYQLGRYAVGYLSAWRVGNVRIYLGFFKITWGHLT